MQLNAQEEIIDKEVQVGRMVGPFSKPLFVHLQDLPVGIVPNTDGRWRLITHLSFPASSRVNYGIDGVFCFVSYSLIDKVSKMIFRLGKNHLWQKET